MSEKFEYRFGNFIATEGDDGIHHYVIKTASPQIEWKVYDNTFLYNLIDKFREDGTEENEEVVKWQLIAMYYVSTVTDANMTSIVYSYIHEFSENIEAGEDIEISQAKAAYYVKEFLTKNLEQ